MTDVFIRLGVLLAIFATVFIVVQLLLRAGWNKREHVSSVNKRLRMINEGRSREEIALLLRRSSADDYSNWPGPIASLLAQMARSLDVLGANMTVGKLLFFMAIAFGLLLGLLGLGVAASGFAISAGVILLICAIAFCVAFMIPVLVLVSVTHRQRRRVEEQFPVSLDIFVRALRAGHPVSSAIDLLTKEMQDPIGSEFGLVADEVAYGAELQDSLAAMAERWDLEDIRMFVVSLSVQNETGGNLAEVLEKLSEVIRARASLYRKVRALSAEGRMTGWMLTILPVATFVGLFLVNPAFYLEVAQVPAFIVGFIALIVLYIIGFIMIKVMVDIKV